jgi:hypothetical protein
MGDMLAAQIIGRQKEPWAVQGLTQKILAFSENLM